MNLATAIVAKHKGIIARTAQPLTLADTTAEASPQELVQAFGGTLATNVRSGLEDFGFQFIRGSLLGIYELRKSWRETIPSRVNR